MEPDSTASTKTAWALLASLFAVNVYRAAMQSITPGEAVTYLRFVGPGWREALASNTANNHVLNTLLARTSIWFFHLSDLALRLPSLLGGILYFWAVYRLSRRMFGTGPLFMAAVALLSLNPLVLDYLSAARGYGMALALWLWALELMLEYLECNPLFARRNLNLAAVCLGMSVASNLAFLIPVSALAAGFIWLPPNWGLRDKKGATLLHHFVIPAFVAAFLVVVIPLNHTDFATFKSGATSLRQTLNSITALSLFHSQPGALPPSLATAMRISAGVLTLLTIGAAAQTIRRREQGRLKTPLVLLAATMFLTFLSLELAHRWFRVPFPAGRSALYFIPVTTLAALALVRDTGRKTLEVAALVVAGLCVAQYLLQFNFRYYGEWPEYAGARSLIKAIRRDAGFRRIRIGASPALEPVLNYYRARYALRHWDPVDPGQPLTDSFDYYVVNQQDAGLVEQRHLRPIYSDGKLMAAR